MTHVDVQRDRREQVRKDLLDSADVLRAAAGRCAEAIDVAAVSIAEALRGGGKVLLCGNGGSAAQSEHLAAEFVGRLSRRRDRPGLPAVALSASTAFVTAHANDCDFATVFARQVEALGQPGDVLIAISCSGTSENVVRAVAVARERGLRTLALTGAGGDLARAVELAVAVPSRNVQRIQEAHLAIGHTICQLVEDSLFGHASMNEAGPP